MSTEETSAPEGEGLHFSFMSHLEELRSRLYRCAVAIVVVFAACFAYSGKIFSFLAAPIVDSLPQGSTLVMLSLTEAFMVEMKVSFVAALVLSSPILFYQLWKFVEPALHANERKYVWHFVVMATFFFLVGLTFAYGFAMPWGFKFFLSYGTGDSPMQGVVITPQISVKAAIDLALQFSLAFGLVFELPVVAYFLARMGVITHKTLSSRRRLAIVGIFIVAAILTPPDAVSQILMAAPLMVLYELSIIIARLVGPKPEPEDDEEEAA